MNAGPQTQTQTAPVPMPAHGGLLQRKCACGGPAGLTGECPGCQKKKLAKHGLQTRLTLNRPGDIYEQEADRVAEEVVRAEPPGVRRSIRPVTALVPSVQRAEEAVEAEDQEDVGGVPEPDSEPGDGEEADDDGIIADDSGMPKRENDAAVSSEPQVAPIHIPSGSGRPLDAGARNYMEQRIGYDFGRVRIHTDSESVESARSLHAHAYTVGSHIYFNEGQYDPGNHEGTKLLAHELTHVVQQTGNNVGRARISPRVQRQRRRTGRRRRTTRPAAPACTGACAPSRSPLHDGCNAGSAAVSGRSITDLTVHRGAHQVVATWSSGPNSTWACSPSTRSGRGGKVPTPLVTNDRVGIKCDKCHTNRHGDGMGWFTGFSSRGRAIGFHNSQRVGPGFESHGCVRVPCSIAKIIHDHSSSGGTTINVVA